MLRKRSVVTTAPLIHSACSQKMAANDCNKKKKLPDVAPVNRSVVLHKVTQLLKYAFLLCTEECGVANGRPRQQRSHAARVRDANRAWRDSFFFPVSLMSTDVFGSKLWKNAMSDMRRNEPTQFPLIRCNDTGCYTVSRMLASHNDSTVHVSNSSLQYTSNSMRKSRISDARIMMPASVSDCMMPKRLRKMKGC